MAALMRAPRPGGEPALPGHEPGATAGPDSAALPGAGATIAMDQATGQAVKAGVPAAAGAAELAAAEPTHAPSVSPSASSPGAGERATEPYHGVFNGVRDELLLEPLRDARVKTVKFNRGGSSISLRIDFENGAQAAFKPEQTALQTVPRKEIAAYRIDRLLGLGAVPPAIARKFTATELVDALAPGSQVFLPRLQEEMRIKNGEIAGELSWWIPVIKKASVDGYEIDSTDGIVTWKRYLTVGKDIPEEHAILMAQISTMVLFDFLINNPDRWSGSNARVSEDRRVLYFMDNTLSFMPDEDGHRKCRIYLKRSQKFSRSLVAAIRALTEESVRRSVSYDKGPFEFLLTSEEIKTLMKRRDYALAYIDELIAEHGEGAVLVFP